MAKNSTKKKKVTIEEDNTRDLFIRHALNLIAEHGFEAVSLREIARSAGFSHMAPYKHFKDKDSLFAAIVEQGFVNLSKKFVDIEQTVLDPEKRFLKMCEVYVQNAIKNPEQFKLMFSGFTKDPEKHPGVKEQSEIAFAGLIRLIEYCQFHKFIKKAPTETIAAFIWSQIHGLASLLIEGFFGKMESTLDQKNLDKFIQLQLVMVLKGIQ